MIQDYTGCTIKIFVKKPQQTLVVRSLIWMQQIPSQKNRMIIRNFWFEFIINQHLKNDIDLWHFFRFHQNSFYIRGYPLYRSLKSEKRIKETTDVRDNHLWNIPNVRRKFYIPDICALFIHIHMRKMYQS